MENLELEILKEIKNLDENIEYIKDRMERETSSEIKDIQNEVLAEQIIKKEVLQQVYVKAILKDYALDDTVANRITCFEVLKESLESLEDDNG